MTCCVYAFPTTYNYYNLLFKTTTLVLLLPIKEGGIMKKDQAEDQQIESRDEMNLAEIPVALLSHRTEPGQKTITYTDTIIVGGKPRKRTITVTGSDKWGLLTAIESDVIAALLLLSYEQGFISSTVKSTLYYLIQKLGWPDSGQSYKRVKEAIERITGITIQTNGWWDNKSKSYRTTKIFHIIEQAAFANLEKKEGLSEFTWSRTVFASIRANNLKYLDFGLFRSLKTQIAKRLYRLLDKRFYKVDCVRYNLFELCHEKLGLSRNLKYRSNLIQKLTPGIQELKDADFLKKAEFITDYVTFYRGAKAKDAIPEEVESTAKTNTRRATNIRTQPLQEKSSDPKDQLVNKLIERGVDRRWVSKYLRNIDIESLARIEDLLEYFDYIVKVDRTKVKSPGGFLRTMLEENWALPPNFKSNRHQKPAEKANEEAIPSGPHVDIFAEDKAYQDWWNSEVDAAIAAKSTEEIDLLGEQVQEEVHRKFSREMNRWTSEMRKEFSQQMLRKQIAKELNLMSFKEWLQNKGLPVPELIY